MLCWNMGFDVTHVRHIENSPSLLQPMLCWNMGFDNQGASFLGFVAPCCNPCCAGTWVSTATRIRLFGIVSTALRMRLYTLHFVHEGSPACTQGARTIGKSVTRYRRLALSTA